LFDESNFDFWLKEAASTFNLSHIFNVATYIEGAAFSFTASYRLICDTLPRKTNARDAIDRTSKYWLFFTRYFDLLPVPVFWY